MPIKRISIKNMARFAEESFDLPLVALIQGGNGTGKTGLLDCIRCLGESGHDPDILRGNAEEGESVITLDDDTQLRVRVTRKETWRGWRPAGGKRWNKGREEIDRIYQAIAYDPLKFLEMKPKEQSDLLAKLSPVQVTVEEVTAAIGDAVEEARAAKTDLGMTGLEVIAAVHKAIYDARTRANTAADTQEKHVEVLEQTLPPAAPEGEDWNDKARILALRKDHKEIAERMEIESVSSQFQTAKDEAQQRFRAECDQINAGIDAQIAALEKQRAELKETASAMCSEAVETARTVANVSANTIRANTKPIIDQMTADLATAQERARAQQQAEGTRKAIEAARKEAEVNRTKSKSLTAALDRLTALKGELAKRLTIPGALIDEGRIVREEQGGLVPLKKWNTADQYTLALKIGMKIGAGFVCVDHVEAFDKPHRDALLRACEKYASQGVQFLLASVDADAGPLRVETPVAQ